MEPNILNEAVIVPDTSLQPEENRRSRKKLWAGLVVVAFCVAAVATVTFYPSIFYKILIAVTPNRVVYVSDEDLDKFAFMIPSPPVNPFGDESALPSQNESNKGPFTPLSNTIVDQKTQVANNPYLCQPESFDPKNSKLIKVDESGFNSEEYTVEDGENNTKVLINNWSEDNKDKNDISYPYDITIYDFGCASMSDYVIEIMNNGVRQNLFTQVLHFDISDDGKRLYLVYDEFEGGLWIQQNRIINLETKKITEIPNADCVDRANGFWQGDYLMTLAETRNKSYSTEACVWDNQGEIKNRFGVNMTWGAAAGSYIAGQIGLVNNNPTTVYAYTDGDENLCSLFIWDRNSNDVKSTLILNKSDFGREGLHCGEPKVEFDLTNTNTDSGSFKFRIDYSSENAAQPVWSEWREASVN